jgi:hypothetical protein
LGVGAVVVVGVVGALVVGLAAAGVELVDEEAPQAAAPSANAALAATNTRFRLRVICTKDAPARHSFPGIARSRSAESVVRRGD